MPAINLKTLPGPAHHDAQPPERGGRPCRSPQVWMTCWPGWSWPTGAFAHATCWQDAVIELQDTGALGHLEALAQSFCSGRGLVDVKSWFLTFLVFVTNVFLSNSLYRRSKASFILSVRKSSICNAVVPPLRIEGRWTQASAENN